MIARERSQGVATPLGVRPAALVWAGVVVGLLVALFGPTWAWAARIWSRSPYYGHGWLLLPVSLFIAYRLWLRRPAAGGAHWPGLLLLACGLVIHLAARAVNVWFPSAFAFLMVVGGIIWFLGGSSYARHFWFPVAYLALAVPLERILVLQLAQPLQLWASSVAATLAAGAGLPVRQIGTTLAMPDYTFEVAIPCSGLKSSIAMTALAALMAYLLEGPVWGRLVVLVAGIPMALIGNTVRILLTLVLARSVGPKAAEGFFHTVSGLVVFGVAFAGLMAVARVVKCQGIRSDI